MRTVIACLLALLIAPATAVAAHSAAAPPPNDHRANATPVAGLPATVSGTTVGGVPLRNVFTGEILTPERAGDDWTIPAAAIFERFPVAILVPADPTGPTSPARP